MRSSRLENSKFPFRFVTNYIKIDNESVIKNILVRHSLKLITEKYS